MKVRLGGLPYLTNSSSCPMLFHSADEGIESWVQGLRPRMVHPTDRTKKVIVLAHVLCLEGYPRNQVFSSCSKREKRRKLQFITYVSRYHIQLLYPSLGVSGPCSSSGTVFGGWYISLILIGGGAEMVYVLSRQRHRPFPF